MWKEYSKEKPTNEETTYLVKRVKTDGFKKGDVLFYLCGYAKNLSKVNEFDFYGRTDGGFYDMEPELGYYSIEENKFNKLYWVDLTELDKEWSKNV